MFPFTCAHCFRKSISAGRPRCLYCGKDATCVDITRDKAISVENEPETARYFDLPSGSVNLFQDKKDIHQYKKVDNMFPAYVKNKKRLNDLRTTDCKEVEKRYRHDTSEKDGSRMYTDRSHKCKNYDCDMTAMPKTMELDNNHSAGIPHNTLKPQESYSLSFGIQIRDNSVKKSAERIIEPGISNAQSDPNENLQTKIFGSRKAETNSSSSNAELLAVQSGHKQTSNFYSEKMNSMSVLGNLSEEYACKTTDSCLNRENTMTVHAVVDESIKWYKCFVCKVRYNKKTDLKNHIQIHGGELFFCDICEELFKEKGSHDSDKTCTVCGEVFSCRTFLVQHSLCHDFCLLCKSSFNEHESDMEDYLLYRCCICPYVSRYKSSMQRHIYTHIAEKAFICDICGMQFAVQVSLKKHKMVNHSNNSK